MPKWILQKGGKIKVRINGVEPWKPKNPPNVLTTNLTLFRKKENTLNDVQKKLMLHKWKY